MLDIQAALTAAGIPGYRGAFRANGNELTPPACYCVYLRTLLPQWPQDDGDSAMRVRAFLHLYARGDPTSHQQALAAAMAQQGFRLIRANEAYDQDADLYEVLSEWEGCQDGCAF